MRHRIAVAAAVLALAGLTAPAAYADSLVYERGGNVWLANPDGSGERQVTSAGGYSRPSQADDGTIIAAKGHALERLDRSGKALNAAGDSDYGAKIFTDLSPDGTLASYGFFATGPILAGPYIAVSHASRPTEKEEIDGPLKGYLNPSWLGNGVLLLFPQSLTVDVQYWPVPGNVQDWFTDPDHDLGGGEADRAMTRFAATADGGDRILLYRMPGPPPALPERVCQVTGAVGGFFRPTWSPDGTRLAWQEDDGIHVMDVNLATCQGQSELVVPGGRHPDWGSADVGAPALSASAPKRIRLAALMRGLKIRVSCVCRATATLVLGRAALGRAAKRFAGPGSMTVRPSANGRQRLRRGGTIVKVRVATPGRSVSRKVRVIR